MKEKLKNKFPIIAKVSCRPSGVKCLFVGERNENQLKSVLHVVRQTVKCVISHGFRGDKSANIKEK